MSAISSLFPNVSSSATGAAASNASANSATQEVQPAGSGTGDTVSLSPAQQVHQLYQQGQAVSQIAVNLSMSVETVNSYLNISSAKI